MSDKKSTTKTKQGSSSKPPMERPIKKDVVPSIIRPIKEDKK